MKALEADPFEAVGGELSPGMIVVGSVVGVSGRLGDSSLLGRCLLGFGRLFRRLGVTVLLLWTFALNRRWLVFTDIPLGNLVVVLVHDVRFSVTYHLRLSLWV